MLYHISSELIYPLVSYRSKALAGEKVLFACSPFQVPISLYREEFLGTVVAKINST